MGQVDFWQQFWQQHVRNLTIMATINRLPDEPDRIRANTSDDINRWIDRITEENIRFYATQDMEEITDRIDDLEEEWDVDRLAQVCVSGTGLTSIIFGTLFSKKWFLLTTASLAFLGNHAVNGWCPSVSVFRRLGFRTRQEIDREKYALKVFRGDFDDINSLEGIEIDDKINAVIAAVKTG